MLYVVGAEQALHLSMVFAVAKLAGWLQAPADAVHLAVRQRARPGPQGLKSRSGDPVNFIDVVDEAIERGQAAVSERNPELTDDERNEIGHDVGVGALKYADLSTDRVRDYIFDWDRMLSFDGNTAPYLQYAHTRICSLFRQGRRRSRLASAPTSADVAEPAERALAVRLLGYEAAVLETAERYSPHRLCTYLFELASGLHDVLRALPRAQGRAGRARQPARTQRPHRPRPRPWPRPARHRRPRPHVGPRSGGGRTTVPGR